MPPSTTIETPGGFAPGYAIGFADETGQFALASAANPVPTQASVIAASSQPIAGSTVTSDLIGPYVPDPGRPVVLQLSGEWSGEVDLLRSTDDGTTMSPVTAGGQPWGSYSVNVCEPVWSEIEVGAQLYLGITLTSGTLEYRIAQ